MSARTPEILVLDDNPVASQLEVRLSASAGVRVVGVLSSGADAIEWLERRRPDVVVLNVELRDDTCIEFANRLVDRKIPFLLKLAESSELTDLNPIFLNAAWLWKTGGDGELKAVIRAAAALGRRSSNVRVVSSE